MAETYTTEAIACGLSDVAGWLENEGGREVIAAARAEYDRWSTGGDTSRPAGERNWACRQNDNDTWAITTYHQHHDEADRARHEQALAAAISVAVPASLAALDTGKGSGGASFGSGSREPGPTVPASGFDPSRTIALLNKRIDMAHQDADSHPEGHINRAFYRGQAIAYENTLSALLVDIHGVTE